MMGTSRCATAMTFTSGGAMGGAALPPQPATRATTKRAQAMRSAVTLASGIERKLRSFGPWGKGGLGVPANSSDMISPCVASNATPAKQCNGWQQVSSKAANLQCARGSNKALRVFESAVNDHL